MMTSKYETALDTSITHYSELTSRLPMSRNKEKFLNLLKEKASAIYFQTSDQNRKLIDETFSKAITNAKNVFQAKSLSSSALSSVDIDKVFKVSMFFFFFVKY